MDDNLITKSGLVDETDPKYDISTPTGEKALLAAIDKFRTFIDNNAVDYNVQFFDNYNYTVFAPTNEAVKAAIEKGLPTWESIQEDYDKCDKDDDGVLKNEVDKLRLQFKITYLTNFIRTHFADKSFFADKSEANVEMTTSSYNNVNGLFVKAFAQRANGQLQVKDNTVTGKWINAVYTTADGRDVKNIMTCDRECNSKVKDQSMNGKTVVATSYAVVHLVDGVLNHVQLNEDGTYPDFQKEAEEAEGKAARAYIQKFAIR
jgi:hypothetical protein